MQKGPVAGTMGSGRRMAIGSPGNAAVVVLGGGGLIVLLGGGGLIVKWSCLIVCEQTVIVRCIQSRLLFFEERERDRQTETEREKEEGEDSTIVACCTSLTQSKSMSCIS